MQLFQDLINRAKQFNQAPTCPEQLHAQQGRYKIIHQALKIPNLPAPLHYLNFYSLIGQPRAPIFEQSHLNITQALDVATVLVSTSMHSVGHFHAYDIQQQFEYQNSLFNFDGREILSGHLPHVRFTRHDDELSLDLNIKTLDSGRCFYQLPWSLGQFWSLSCQCLGQLHYAGQTYPIEQRGVLEYARSINFAYLPFAFYVYQLIELSDTQQIIVLQLRDQFNSILYSRLYLKDFESDQVQVYDQHLELHIDRVYPLVKTPNHHSMYLPRNFHWQLNDANRVVRIAGESRGDFKFGLGAGFVGSFSYRVVLDDQVFEGEHAYCEYIDCRSLKYQELNQPEKMSAQIDQKMLAAFKNTKNDE